MKEVELIGTTKEIYEKLKAHIGQKLCQYVTESRYEDLLLNIISITDETIILSLQELGTYSYLHGHAPPLFLCFERDKVSETFDEMVRRKQQEIFWSLK